MKKPHEHGFDWNDVYTGDVTDCHEPDRMLLEIVDTLEPGSALDVGCGAGGLAVALLERGWRVTGVDIASNAIAAANKVLAARGFDAELYVADAATWKPPAQYDLVLNSFALPFEKADQAKVFRMAKEALAPGGTLVLKDFDSSMKRHEPFSTFHCPTVEELLAAFDGLEILRAEVVETPVHRASESEGPWTAALLHARKAPLAHPA